MATYKTRIPSCFLLLVTAFVLMAFQGFHKIRDGRLSNDIISEKIAEIESLREQLQVPKFNLNTPTGHSYLQALFGS